MRAAEPAELAAAFERGVPVPDGTGDRFAGYAVLGVSFKSGDVLALRRFPVSSSGPAYTSVWHYDPAGRWTFYADVPATQGCARYFAPAVARSVVAPIRVEWNGPRSLAVAVDGGRAISWSLELRPTILTHVFNSAAPALSRLWLKHPRLLDLVAIVARVALGVGPLRLTGRTPAGSRFMDSPLAVWLVQSSRATIAGLDAGPGGRLRSALALGDFHIPRRGLFATSHAFMTPERQS
jgi:hypothetical protein